MQQKHNKLDKINKNQLFVGNGGDAGDAAAAANTTVCCLCRWK